MPFMQRTAKHCNTLCLTATRCNALQHTATHSARWQQCCTGWRRLIGSPKLQIIFHKRATKYRALLRKMSYKDKGSYESSPPCTAIHNGKYAIHATHCNTLQHTVSHCNALQHTATHSARWQQYCTAIRNGKYAMAVYYKCAWRIMMAVCCSVLQCCCNVAVCCSVL